MNIRQWLGYDNPVNQLSEVDLKLDTILNQYRGIFEKYCDIETSEHLANLEKKVTDAIFNGEVFSGFISWFTEEGKTALIGLARYLYEEDEELLEELNYLEFILSSEMDNVEEYPDDVVGSLADITDQLESLLSTAVIKEELTSKSNRIIITPEVNKLLNYDLTDYNKTWPYHFLLRGNNLTRHDSIEIWDSYINCEGPFYLD